MIQKLMERYRQYSEEAALVRKKAKPTDGLLGFGNDPRNNPCHQRFYEDVGQWTKDFLATQPNPEDSLEAARFLIAAPKTCGREESYGMMYAALGWCRELVDRLDAKGCAELGALLEELYPKRDRMPVQLELLKALNKKSGRKDNPPAWFFGKNRCV